MGSSSVDQEKVGEIARLSRQVTELHSRGLIDTTEYNEYRDKLAQELKEELDKIKD